MPPVGGKQCEIHHVDAIGAEHIAWPNLPSQLRITGTLADDPGIQKIPAGIGKGKPALHLGGPGDQLLFNGLLQPKQPLAGGRHGLHSFRCCDPRWAWWHRGELAGERLTASVNRKGDKFLPSWQV